MTKVSELLNKLAKDAGINPEDENLKNLLSDPKLSEVELPEEFTGTVFSKLMTLDSAKNNPEIAKAFKGQYMGTVNRDVEKFLKESELPDEVIEKIQSESDSLARFRAAMKVYSEHTEGVYKKKFLENAPNAEEFKKREDDLAKKINELNNELAIRDNEKVKLKQELLSQFEQERINWELDRQLGNYEFSDSMPKEDARLLIAAKLEKLPYVFRKNTDGSVGVFQKDDPSLEAFKDNKKLSVTDVLDELAAPYLKKKETKPEGEGQKRRFEAPKGQNGSKFTFGGHGQKVNV